MKTWYPICLSPDTFESGYMVLNHDTLKVEKYHGVFKGKWEWDSYHGGSVRRIVNNQ